MRRFKVVLALELGKNINGTLLVQTGTVAGDGWGGGVGGRPEIGEVDDTILLVCIG